MKKITSCCEKSLLRNLIRSNNRKCNIDDLNEKDKPISIGPYLRCDEKCSNFGRQHFRQHWPSTVCKSAGCHCWPVEKSGWSTSTVNVNQIEKNALIYYNTNSSCTLLLLRADGRPTALFYWSTVDHFPWLTAGCAFHHALYLWQLCWKTLFIYKKVWTQS